MSSWGWSPERTQGIWRYGALWLRPLIAVAPWLTVALLLLQFHLIGGAMTTEKGLLFDLPEASVGEGEATDLVVLVMPMAHDTLVFFDDSRYLLGEANSRASLHEHMTERVSLSSRKTVLVLADRRVAGGELMKFAAIARGSGAARLLFAEKKDDQRE